MAISAASISVQDVGFSTTVAGRVWRWKTRLDVTGAYPVYAVVEIVTPFGLFRDTIPLPGEVVQAMSESIDTLKATYKPRILVGPPTSLGFAVDEGRGLSVTQTVLVANNGTFGSLLNAVLTSSAPYIQATPGSVGNLASNESGSFSVAVDSTDLVASSSPYSGMITVQDPTALNTPQTVPVLISVRPKAVIVLSTPLVQFSVVRPISGPFPVVPSQQFNVSNTGASGSVLEFQVARLTGLSLSWLSSFTPVSGTVTTGVQAVSILVEPVDGLLPGTYEETLRVSGYSLNNYVDVSVRLVVT